ncbi:MAG TPA: hypothetical protein PL143_16625 [Rhodocyclaceae bacterium]|nr:hypothetical protein [Rhodocyclaceae bacterium]
MERDLLAPDRTGTALRRCHRGAAQRSDDGRNDSARLSPIADITGRPAWRQAARVPDRQAVGRVSPDAMLDIEQTAVAVMIMIRPRFLLPSCARTNCNSTR